MPPSGVPWCLLLWVGWGAAVLLEPFATDLPPFAKAKHPLKPSLFSSHLQAPFPTNAWWQDAVLEDGGNPIYPEPYHVQLLGDGVLMALNPKVLAPSTRYIYTPFEYGLKLNLGSNVKHEVIEHDLLSVTAQYTHAKSSTPLITVPVVRGSPYITALYKQEAPVAIDTIGCHIVGAYSDKNAKANHKMPSTTLAGTVFTFTLNTTQTWLLFTDKEVSLKWSDTHISAAKVHEGATLRFAAVPAGAAVPATTSLLGKHARCVPLGGSVEPDVLDAEAVVKFSWRAISANNRPCSPLILALPHMQGVLSKKSHTFTSLQYDGLLGPMVGVVAMTWGYSMPLANVSWFAPQPVRPDMRAALRSQAAADTKDVGFAPEPYAFGKQICRFARISLIAEELEAADTVGKADGIIKDAFTMWLGGQGSDALVYDETWFGTVPSNGLSSPDADFGAGYYNDHHFHYGYWLYAAAVVARHDADWAAKYAPHFKALARDIANPSKADPHYPLYRYFDWYAGHSWAAGLMAFSAGRNQESTSEAINAWYAMQLYGEAIGDDSMRRTGQLLAAHEMEAARVYWRSTAAHSVYPAEFAKHKGVGMVWESKVDVATWFGAGPVYALAINIMPYTPITEWYLRKDWVREAFPILEKEVSNGFIDDWKVIVYMAQAQINPKAAWTNLQSISVRSDEGMTLSNVIWWVATRPDPAKPDPPLPHAVDVLPVVHHSPAPPPSAPG
eukprot:EG_transcript_4740